MLDRVGCLAQARENQYAQQLQSMFEPVPVGAVLGPQPSFKADHLNTTTLQTAPGQPESILKRDSSVRAFD